MTPVTRWVGARPTMKQTLIVVGRCLYVLALAGVAIGLSEDQWRLAVIGIVVAQAGIAVDIRLQSIAYTRRTTEIVALWGDTLGGGGDQPAPESR